MKKQPFVWAVVLGALFLFVWDGLFQAIPNFGIRAVEAVDGKWPVDFEPGMRYVQSDKSVALIASQPAAYYQPGKFLVIEFVCAFLVAWLLGSAINRLQQIGLQIPFALVGLFAGMACVAIHFSYANWWGFSLPYTLGVVVKLLSGWLILAYLQSKILTKA